MFQRPLIAFALIFALAVPTLSDAKTLRWSSQGDIMTFDPHSQNEGLTLTANGSVYEGLVAYNPKFEIVPCLATEWKEISPTVWRFKLRQGVKFHDGTPFTADDVVFSIKRAMAPTSNYKAYTTGIKEIRKGDDLSVEIETSAPNPVLLRQLPNLFIMSHSWAEKNNVLEPQDILKKTESYATRHTNGTGPYKLVSREVDVRTVFTENTHWWNKSKKVGNVTDIIYLPIKQNATRTAALLSGEIDFVLDPAAQDLDRLRKQAKVIAGSENRTIFIGLDQKRPELVYSNIKGKNPFADVRVREALYRAIDIEAIRKTVMRGFSAPTGTMIAPQVHGWSKTLHQRVPYDVARSRELLKTAGYENNLQFTLDCPNNRYLNDEVICQAIVAMWAKVGVKATLNSMPRATYFPKIQSDDTSAYMLGWGVPTFDAYYTLQSVIHTRGTGAEGDFNLGNYSNKAVDTLINQIKVETDNKKRDEAIAKALTIHAKEFGHIPLHDQVIPWAMRKNVNVIHNAENRLVAEWVKID